jgi:GNAT superfamily N-acetyltransferase
MKLRLMRSEDIPEVLALYDSIYSDWIEKGAHRKISVPDTAAKTLAAYLHSDPRGCFVLQENGLSGFAFSHCWGKLGWLGPLGVTAEERGRGFGKSLTQACVKYLRSFGCSLIGLETVSAQNIGLYVRLGFFPILPRVRLFKEVEGREMPGGVRLLSENESEKSINALRRICGELEPGLDYTHETLACEKRGIGKTLLVANKDKVFGYAFLQTLPSREEKRPLAMIKMLAIGSKYTRRKILFNLLDACEALAHDEGKEEISLKVYSGYRNLLKELLRYGYAVQSSTLRMVLQGTYTVKEKLYCGYAWSS